MRHHRKTIDEILKEHVSRASSEEVASVGERVLYRLHHATARQSLYEESTREIVAQRPVWNRRWAVLAAVLGVIMAIVFSRISWRKPSSPVESHVAVVEFIDGALRGVQKEQHRVMQVNDTLEVGESVRTGSGAGAGLTLSDGSRIEIRAESELTLERANDGTRIRLGHGSIIVNATKQGAGHLYVETRHINVSVIGTIFFVSAAESGSEAGVIEGEVRVRRGESEVSLSPGEHIFSGSFVKERLFPETIAWSRDARALIALLAPPVQTPPSARPQRPSFEVASIRKNPSGSTNGGIRPRGDRLVATNVTAKMLMAYAYKPKQGQLLKAQIIGGPGWTETDRFDIEAKIGTGASSTPVEQIQAMVVSLLEERFRLKAVLETRELPVYNLVLVKNGPKLSADQTPGDPRQAFVEFVSEGETIPALPRGAVVMVESPYGTTLTGTAIPVSMLVTLLQGRSDRIILDKTGFNGFFDLDFRFAKDSGAIAPTDMTIPFLFTAIQEIGFKLEPAKAALPVVIVDKVEKPTEN
jgi:uncharacterized protein (TIGR03435 family)